MSPKSIIATVVAFAGAAVAQSLGSLTVVNSCSSAAYYKNVPAGSSEDIPVSTLQPGANYTQEWTVLSNGGWSLKLSPTASTTWESNILQLEYTWSGWGVNTVSPNLVFWDVSEVNGSPWDSEWELSAIGDCSIAQIAYLYPDDNGATQSCPAGDSIIISLCPGSGDSTASPSPASSAFSSAESTPTPAASPSSSTTVAAAPTKTQHAKLGSGNNRDNVQTTLATVVTPAANQGGVTVTEVATEIVTNFVTATNGAVAMDKRHEHVARHAHHHHH